uniref:Uncharacterized protein n=1 Tax=Lepeophtheirus salmonis TaxID=72036 RepID=A0A0K2TK71_LEPSM
MELYYSQSNIHVYWTDPHIVVLGVQRWRAWRPHVHSFKSCILLSVNSQKG